MLTLHYTLSIFKRSNILTSSWFLKMVSLDLSPWMERGMVNTSRVQEVAGKQCCYFLLYHDKKRYKACFSVISNGAGPLYCDSSTCTSVVPITRRNLLNHGDSTDFYNSVAIRSLFGISCKTTQHRVEITRPNVEDWITIKVSYVGGLVGLSGVVATRSVYFRMVSSDIKNLTLSD